jgi:hypothetical protein
VALAAWQGAEGRLAEIFRQTWGGAFIARLGLDADLAVCTQVDTMDVLPQARGNPPVIAGEGGQVVGVVRLNSVVVSPGSPFARFRSR